jgi:hypothetical protein
MAAKGKRELLKTKRGWVDSSKVMNGNRCSALRAVAGVCGAADSSHELSCSKARPRAPLYAVNITHASALHAADNFTDLHYEHTLIKKRSHYHGCQDFQYAFISRELHVKVGQILRQSMSATHDRGAHSCLPTST